MLDVSVQSCDEILCSKLRKLLEIDCEGTNTHDDSRQKDTH